MQRRRLLKLGLGAGAVLALAGGAAALLSPGLAEGRLSASGRAVLRAVARAVLAGSLPEDATARAAALEAQLDRLDGVIAGFPPATVAELGQLLGLIATAPGRLALVGLATPWDQAGEAEIAAALQALRVSGLALRVQAYQALRDLTNAAWYAEPAAWAALGYPGPRALPA